MNKCLNWIFKLITNYQFRLHQDFYCMWQNQLEVKSMSFVIVIMFYIELFIRLTEGTRDAYKRCVSRVHYSCLKRSPNKSLMFHPLLCGRKCKKKGNWSNKALWSVFTCFRRFLLCTGQQYELLREGSGPGAPGSGSRLWLQEIGGICITLRDQTSPESSAPEVIANT